MANELNINVITVALSLYSYIQKHKNVITISTRNIPHRVVVYSIMLFRINN